MAGSVSSATATHGAVLPLDPTLQQLLGPRPTETTTTEEPPVDRLRQDHRTQVSTFTPESTRRPALMERRELQARDGSTVSLRVYRPVEGGTQPMPAVLWMHGGCWVTGDLDTADPVAREIAAAGAVVVTVDYRRAPEHPFPAAVTDCLDAMGWLATHAPELGGDPSALGVAGDSAGGNLAAVVAQDPAWRGGSLSAQLLVYPVLDARGDVGPYPSRAQSDRHPTFALPVIARTSALYRRDTVEEQDPRVSPIAANDLSGIAPAVIVSVGYDLLQDEDFMYAAQLRAAGIPVVHHDDPTLAHGVVDLIGSLPTARELLGRAIEDFLHLLTPTA